MGRADDRFDPTSPFAMRPLFRLLAATVAVGICALMVFVHFSGRPQPLFVPVDAKTGKPAAFAIYVTSAAYGRVDPKTGAFTSGSLFNHTWPHGLLVAAWEDGRVAWSTGDRPEDGEVGWGTTSPQAVESARDRLVKAGPSLLSAPPSVRSDGPETTAYVCDEGTYHVLSCQIWQLEPKAATESQLAPFREKWAALRAIALAVVPREEPTQIADWIQFHPVR